MAVKIKRNKVQVYTKELITNSKPALYKKLYLYSEEQYNAGGLWTYVRDSSTNERFTAQSNDIQLSAIFVLNYNETIIKESRSMFVEFKNSASRTSEVYQVIGKPDRYEYGFNDIKLSTELKTDDTTYSEIGYTEEE